MIESELFKICLMMTSYHRIVSSLQELCLPIIIEGLPKLKNHLRYIPIHFKSELMRLASCRENVLADPVILEYLLHPYSEILDISSCNVTDEMLKSVSTSQHLRIIDLGDSTKDITADGLKKLIPKLPKLEKFVLKRCNILDDALIEELVIHCPLLKAIDIAYCCQITNKTMDSLKNIQLHALNIAGTKVSDDGVLSILESECANTLTELILSNCPITNKSIEVIFSKCPYISILIFKNCHITGDFQTGNGNMRQIAWSVV